MDYRDRKLNADFRGLTINYGKLYQELILMSFVVLLGWENGDQ